MDYNIFPEFLRILHNVLRSFALSVPYCEHSVALHGNEFIAPYRRALEMFLVVWPKNKQLQAVGFCELCGTLVHTASTAANDSRGLEGIHANEFANVGILYSPTSYDCEFHAAKIRFF